MIAEEKQKQILEELSRMGYWDFMHKDSFQETFTAYVQRLRLSKACELLKESILTIDEVAAAVGYSSAPVFRRAFKRQYGIPQAIYRENMSEALNSFLFPDCNNILYVIE